MIFQYRTLRIRVESPDAAVLHWLREFLTPAFAVAEEAAADHVVELVVDDRAYAELSDDRPPELGELDCFALDSQMVRLPLWRSTPAERVVFDSPNRVLYRVQADPPLVRVLTPTRNLAARFALLRVVRELAMSAARADGVLVLHGAALSTPAGAVVIAGPKGAGKTTVLIHSLRAVGGRFVANDRVVVDLRAAEPVLHGMPTLVTVREPTLAGLQDLRDSTLRSGYDHRLALGERAPEGARTAPPRPGRPVDLSPAQFCALLGVRAAGQAPLRALLFPVLSATGRGVEVRELAAATAVDRLQHALFGVGSRGAAPQLLVGAPPFGDEDGKSSHLRRTLSQRVPAFEWKLGEDAYRDEARLARLVGELFDAGSGPDRGLSAPEPGGAADNR